MIIYIKKRYIILLLATLLGVYMIISNGQTTKKILSAKNISELNGNYNTGDYVKLNFDKILYIEYDGLTGRKEKRYAVCSTLEGDVFFVNGVQDTYVLVEIVNENMIKDIENSSKKTFEIIGVIQNCTYDISDYVDIWDANVKLEKKIVIKETDYSGIYSSNLLIGCYIIIFCVVLFFFWGGIHSIVIRRKNSDV